MVRRIVYASALVLILLLAGAVGSYWIRRGTRTAAVVTSPEKICSPCAKTIIIAYEDFGPPVIAYQLEIGHAWNQWKNEGHELPDDVDINVVVYRGIELEEVRKQFPVIRGKSDYRYLDHARAIQFLEEQIKAVESYKAEEAQAKESEPNAVKMWDELGQRLKKTRKLIIESLGT